ncbi:MAG: hypothetical protein C4532_13810 [Candidatus Abyssobacteria bacterium SURF_17]|uniref:Uncharacterized protein n=1 Tax=Candidatus Abyssobacteria bacterium SURF_17 TaxID=2093361 RepID=A0A419EUI9_9BACT|nr:MAG: hypothetical protein C4532_13810 [Candidatus Abyssubacteria bacterium SURF_17]
MTKKRGKPVQEFSEHTPFVQAFRVYWAAVELTVVCLCPECEDAPSLRESLTILRDELGKLNPTGVCKELLAKFSGYLGEVELPTRDELLTEVSVLIKAIVEGGILPPLRRVDWAIRLNNFPLLFVDDIRWVLQVRHEKPTHWNDFLGLTALSGKAKTYYEATCKKLDSYAAIDSEVFRQIEADHPDTNWFVSYLKDSEGRPYAEVLSEARARKDSLRISCLETLLRKVEDDFHRSFRNSSGASLHRIFSRTTVAEALRCLASDYWQTMDEYAALTLNYLRSKDQTIGKIDRERFSAYAEHLKKHADGAFAKIVLLADRFPDLFFQPNEKPQPELFRLYDPQYYETSTQWRKECLSEILEDESEGVANPFGKLKKVVTVAEVQDMFPLPERETELADIFMPIETQPEPPSTEIRSAAPSTQGITETAKGNVFCKEGEYWTVTYAGETHRYRDSRGMQYIGYLLAHPQKVIKALDLVHEVQGVVAPTSAQMPYEKMDKEILTEEGLTKGRLSEQKILDKKALKQIRQRKAELNQLLEEVRWKDPEQVGEIERELESIEKALRETTTITNRSRTFSDSQEKARKAVWNAIDRCLDNIKKDNEALFAHLKNALNLGKTICYSPDSPVDWTL